MFHPVKEPRHYAGDGKIACMDALRSMFHGTSNVLSATQIYWWGCAFKYLWRWPWKNGKQDIDKCMRCLEYLKKELEDVANEGKHQAGQECIHAEESA